MTILDGEFPVRINEGDYSCICYGYLTRKSYFGPKVFILFRVSSGGIEYQINKYYSVKALRGHVGDNGAFVVGAKSDLFRDLVRLLGKEVAANEDLPLLRFIGRSFVCRIRTVKTDSRGEDLCKEVQYSKIERIKRMLPIDEDR